MARIRKHQVGEEALAVHRRMRGKFGVVSRVPIRTARDLSLLYTPGVAAVSSRIARYPKEAWDLTMKGRTVAVVSDGSAVLGLGNIGPEAALPVMEGKCAIFKEFADVDAVPLVLGTQDPEKIIQIVKMLSPGFGGINLEDIAAPQCFMIEERLTRELEIPVMHDDQHGTAIVVLAALLNAAKVVKKRLRRMRIVISGAGAAGNAVTRLLLQEGVGDILVVDRKGILHKKRKGLDPYKHHLAAVTNARELEGGLEEAILGADAFVGVSGPRILHEAHVRMMAAFSIVCALANPIPEIMPDAARRAGAAVIATGRSDFPNQINNSLAFPGVFRGALDHRVRRITDIMKRRAAHAIARLVPRPVPERIVPSMFDARLVKAVSAVIR